MKKLIIMFMLAIVLSLALTCANAAIETETIDHTGHIADIQAAHPESVPVFKLPASLQVIEDEAFEGTAIVSVDLPESVESIATARLPASRACGPLRSRRIPLTLPRRLLPEAIT